MICLEAVYQLVHGCQHDATHNRQTWAASTSSCPHLHYWPTAVGQLRRLCSACGQLQYWDAAATDLCCL